MKKTNQALRKVGQVWREWERELCPQEDVYMALWWAAVLWYIGVSIIALPFYSFAGELTATRLYILSHFPLLVAPLAMLINMLLNGTPRGREVAGAGAGP